MPAEPNEPVTDVDGRMAIAASLVRKLPDGLAGHARPIDERCQMSLALSFEPWLAFVQDGRRLELHILDGATAKLIVDVTGSESKPAVSKFVRGNSGLEAFTGLLAQELLAAVR